MTLAETPQLLNGGGLLVVLMLLLLTATALGSAAVLGCVWAYRAGRGSRLARDGWVAVALAETLLQLLLATSIPEGGVTVWSAVPAGLLALQVALCVGGRRRRPAPAAAGDHPPGGSP